MDEASRAGCILELIIEDLVRGGRRRRRIHRGSHLSLRCHDVLAFVRCLSLLSLGASRSQPVAVENPLIETARLGEPDVLLLLRPGVDRRFH